MPKNLSDVYIRAGEVYSEPLKYILTVLAQNKQLPISFTEKSKAKVVFDHSDPSSLPINVRNFELLLREKKSNHKLFFADQPHWTFPESNKPDWLGSAFYMINSFQEYQSESTSGDFDAHQRYSYAASYQHKFNCVEDNLVQKYFDNFCAEIQLTPQINNENRSRIFISHDIDSIHGSFLQDGLWAMKKGRVDIVMKLVLNEILARPHWTNMDKIVKLHTEHNLNSTFFWLATKKTGSNGIKNADYSQRHIQKQSALTSSNGLHKSGFESSIDEELDQLPFKTKWNRYHFLKISLPETWNTVEASRLEFDASLGFAERYGFRNSYGLPFRPYNVATSEAYNFVEVPLNMMDGTFQKYMKIPVAQTSQKIIEFIEKNKVNCVLSLLWHNTFFTSYKYKGYLEEYRKVLLYLNETGVKSITPEQIVNEYLHGRKN